MKKTKSRNIKLMQVKGHQSVSLFLPTPWCALLSPHHPVAHTIHCSAQEGGLPTVYSIYRR